MRNIILVLFVFASCVVIWAQDIIRYVDLKYIGYEYVETLNNSFINKRILFFKASDSVIFNIRIPFSMEEKKVYDTGIFYNCILRKDSLYSFELKKAFVSEIPKEYNSYYITNGVFPYKKKSKFTEIKKDTKYMYQGNNGMFIDINHELYLILKMTPEYDCIFQH